MPSGVYLGFDFGYKRIGVAVGQTVTRSAKPLNIIPAKEGIPDWQLVARIIDQWRPKALIVGLPTCIDGKEQYTTVAAKNFSIQLAERFALPVHLVDERLTTVEARAEMFAQGGYRKIKNSPIDSIAAWIILEQWVNDPLESP